MKNIKKTSMLAAAIVIALVNVNYADAADVNEPEYMTRDVVVTASRTEQEIKDAPAAVEVITSQDMENMGAESVAQALQLAAGIDITATGMGGTNAVQIRGMKSIQTLIMVDGRRIRTEDTDSTANNYELNRFNVDDIERIEIVRGASSSLYGADAMGGVINIITKSAKQRATSLSGDWTSRQSDVGIRHATGTVGKWDFSFNYKHSRIRNITSNTHESSRGDSKLPNMLNMPEMVGYSKSVDASSTVKYGNRDFFNLKANYAINDKKRLEFFADYMKEDLRDASYKGTIYTFDKACYTILHKMLGGIATPSPVDSFSYGGSTANTKYDNSRTSAGIAYKGSDSKGDYQLRYSYSKLDKDQKSYVNGVFEDFDKMIFTQHIFDGQRSIQLGDKHLMTYGGEYRSEEYAGTRTGSGGAVHIYSEGGLTKKGTDTNLSYSSAYIVDEWMPNDYWIIIPSLRLDNNNRFGNKLTYKLGSTNIINDQLRWKLNVGTAYRAPTASEMFMEMNHKPVAGIDVHVYGNENLSPETSVNTDIGVEFQQSKTTFKGTWFMNKVKNMITTDDDGTGRTDESAGIYYQKYLNIDKATIQGVEFEANQQMTDRLNLRGVYTYLDARDDMTDSLLTGRSRHKASIQLSYHTPSDDFTSTLWYDWYDGFKYSKTQEANVGVLNFVMRKKVNKNASVYLGVNNITNKFNDLLYFDGRIWRAGFNLKF